MKKIILFFFFILLLCPFSVLAKEDESVILYFFHGDGCPHCEAEKEYLDTIQDQYPNLVIKEY